jgi:hypothetical protein
MIGILFFNVFLSKKLSNLMPKIDLRYEIRDMRVLCLENLSNSLNRFLIWDLFLFRKLIHSLSRISNLVSRI